MTEPAVAGVVVTHRGAGPDLDRALAALRRAGGLDLLVVVDNSDAGAPIDGADRVVRVANRGYGAAVNAAVATLTGDWADADVAVLNDDVIVEPGWVEPLRAALAADPHVGAVQPALLDDATPDATVNGLGVQLDRYGAGSDIGRGSRWSDVDRHGHDITLFTGGAVLVRRRYFERLGGFDERYFLYYEDVDLAFRGVEAGWRHRCEPSAVVVHEAGATTSTIGDRLRHEQEVNRLRCAGRHGTWKGVALAVWLSVRRCRHAPRRVHVRALAAGVATLPRGRLERWRAMPPGNRARHRLRRGLQRRTRRLLPSRRPARAGVNVLGYHGAVSGLGHVAGRLVDTLEAAGLDVVRIDAGGSASPRAAGTGAGARRLHPTTIAVVTAPQLPDAWARHERLADATDRLVGYLFWELGEVPSTHHRGLELLDRIWAPTRFVADAYRSAGGPPVDLVPLRIAEPAVDDELVARWRRELVPGGERLVVTSFDFLSVMARKHPVGAVDAFRLADLAAHPARLVVKTINGDQRPDDVDELLASFDGDDRITLLDRVVPPAELDALVAAADCFVSLHRAEGLGLHLATAMWVGTPVVATGWSGNLDLMDEDTAELVPYELVPVSGGRDAYPGTSRWADADVSAAAAAIGRVLGDPEHAARLARSARARMMAQPTDVDLGAQLASMLDLAPSPDRRPTP